MQVNNEEMNWAYRFMAMAVGGVSSLFALFFSPPETHREAMIRFAAGCVVAFTMTGTFLGLMRISVNTDSVLAAGLIWGSIGWFVLGGLVQFGKSGGALAYLAKLVQGHLPKTNDTTATSDMPRQVKEIVSSADHRKKP